LYCQGENGGACKRTTRTERQKKREEKEGTPTIVTEKKRGGGVRLSLGRVEKGLPWGEERREDAFFQGEKEGTTRSKSLPFLEVGGGAHKLNRKNAMPYT